MFDLSRDGKTLAYVKNEDGVRVLHVLNLAGIGELPLPKLPSGVTSSLRWHLKRNELGFSMNNARSPGDCYSLDVTTGKVERWTTSENRGENRHVPGSGTRALEEFRRENDPWILVQTCGEILRQAARSGGDSRRTRRPVAADVSRTRNPFRIRTYEKRARNSFRIRTSKTQDLKFFRIRTYEKRRGEGYKLLTRVCRIAVRQRTAKSPQHRPFGPQAKQECLCYCASSAKSLVRGAV